MLARTLAAALTLPIGVVGIGALAVELDPHDMRFTKLQVEDWPETLPMRPLIEFRLEHGRQVYHVTAPSSCGLEIRKPSYRILGKSLTLSYEEYADGPVATDVCAFNSEFSFKGLPSQALNAELVTAMAVE